MNTSIMFEKINLVATDLKIDSKRRNLLGETKQKYGCVEQIGLKFGLQIYRSTAD